MLAGGLILASPIELVELVEFLLATDRVEAPLFDVTFKFVEEGVPLTGVVGILLVL